jgi:hypothetical protein
MAGVMELGEVRAWYDELGGGERLVLLRDVQAGRSVRFDRRGSPPGRRLRSVPRCLCPAQRIDPLRV